MEINSFFKKLSIGTPAECFRSAFSDAQNEFEKSGVFFLEDTYIAEVSSICGCLSNCCKDLKSAAALARNNPDIALFALFLYKAMQNRENFYKHLPEFIFPQGDTAEYDFLPLFPFLPALPDLYEHLKAHNVPQDVICATLKQFEDCVYLYEDRFGRPGLNKRYFDHMQLYVDAKILNIGRLRFQRIDRLDSHILVLKNEEKGIKILFNGEDINSRGMIKGTPPAIENEDCFYAEVAETADFYKGCAATEKGMVSTTPEIFPKSEWKSVLKEGDTVLGVHIPATGALTEELCNESFDRAKQIFKDCYPEFNYKAFHCHTWMFDPKLKEFLPEDSNIIKFQNRFTLFPGETMGEDVFNFVFKLQFTEYKDMPEDTSLQRWMKKLYLGGKYIYEFEGIFF